MIILKKDGETIEGLLSEALEHEDNFTEYDGGILKHNDLFMLADRAIVSAPLSEHRQPIFCFFNRRLKPEGGFRGENNYKSYTWHNHLDQEVPWLGLRLNIHDTTGDKEINNINNFKGCYLLEWLMSPHVGRYGKETELIISNAVKVYGLEGRKGGGFIGSSGGNIFSDETGYGSLSLGKSSAVVFPRQVIYRNNEEFQPDHESPIKTHKIDASHMYIGYNSIVAGLKDMEDKPLNDWFKKNFHERLDADRKIDQRYTASLSSRKGVTTN
ncbi:hypothetical protein CMI38_01745 [Candidatus Pacearchaeota archaeon]|jgi:hypothetical protein|nr:hypothetical protein [Candidatus Pacearchaeota archaeon]|tara:strand:- start:50 stop:859 length:810 start_codon:yes stop_codon:yes gene_type:complete